MFRASELADLAKVYCAEKGMTLAGLGEMVIGNHKFFKLLVAGKGAHSSNIEQASDWFVTNWPADLAWPEAICRPAAEARQEAA